MSNITTSLLFKLLVIYKSSLDDILFYWKLIFTGITQFICNQSLRWFSSSLLDTWISMSPFLYTIMGFKGFTIATKFYSSLLVSPFSLIFIYIFLSNIWTLYINLIKFIQIK